MSFSKSAVVSVYLIFLEVVFMQKEEFLNKFGDIDVFHITLSKLQNFLPDELDIDDLDDAEALANEIGQKFTNSTYRDYGNMFANATTEALLNQDGEQIPTETLKRRRGNIGSASVQEKIEDELERRGELERS